MRVVCFSFVRNEQDIIEAFVRHTLAYCDDLIVLDHGSSDATAEILHRLKAEGLPLHLLSDPNPGTGEPEHTRQLFELAAREFSADWVLGLDADEFLDGPADRSFLPQHVEGETPCLKMRMRNYYAHADDRADIVNPVERLTRRPAQEQWQEGNLSQYKVAVPGWMARARGATITVGKHQLFIDGHEAPHHITEEAWLAHFSLRSPAQYAAKLISKQINKYHHISPMGDELSFYDAPYEILRRNFSEFARTFPSMRLSWQPAADSELVHAPMQYRGGPLRHTPHNESSDLVIRDLVDFSERLARLKKNEASASPAPAQVRSVDVVSYPTPDHKSVQYFTESSPNYTQMRLPLVCSKYSDALMFCFNLGPGLLEIRRIELSGENATRSAEGETLQSMLRVMSGGAAILSHTTQRVMLSKRPLRITFSGWREGDDLPGEVMVEFRHEVAGLEAVFLNPEVLEHINHEHNLLADQAKQPEPSAAPVRKERASAKIYTPGSVIDFTIGGNSVLYTARGWSGQESWGTWTDGSVATLRLRLDAPPAGALELAVKAVTVTIPERPVMEANVKLNDVHVAGWKYDSLAAVWNSVVIPQDVLQMQEIEIAFEIPSPLCPKDHHLSGDSRRLGIGVLEVELRVPAEAVQATGGPS